MTRRLTLFALLLACRAFAADQVVLPGPVSTATTQYPSTANQLLCATVPAPASIAATHFSAVVATGTGGATCGWGIYPDSDSGTVLASVSGSCATSATVLTTSGLSLSISRGDLLRVCTCSTASSAGAFYAAQSNSTGAGYLSSLLNTFSAHVGTAANACTSGAVPSTTGTITAANGNNIPFVVLTVVTTTSTSSSTSTSTSSSTTTVTSTSVTTTTGTGGGWGDTWGGTWGST
jgi:hypothetical protein